MGNSGYLVVQGDLDSLKVDINFISKNEREYRHKTKDKLRDSVFSKFSNKKHFERELNFVKNISELTEDLINKVNSPDEEETVIKEEPVKPYISFADMVRQREEMLKNSSSIEDVEEDLSQTPSIECIKETEDTSFKKKVEQRAAELKNKSTTQEQVVTQPKQPEIRVEENAKVQTSKSSVESIMSKLGDYDDDDTLNQGEDLIEGEVEDMGYNYRGDKVFDDKMVRYAKGQQDPTDLSTRLDDTDFSEFETITDPEEIVRISEHLSNYEKLIEVAEENTRRYSEEVKRITGKEPEFAPVDDNPLPHDPRLDNIKIKRVEDELPEETLKDLGIGKFASNRPGFSSWADNKRELIESGKLVDNAPKGVSAEEVSEELKAEESRVEESKAEAVKEEVKEVVTPKEEVTKEETTKPIEVPSSNDDYSSSEDYDNAWASDDEDDEDLGDWDFSSEEDDEDNNIEEGVSTAENGIDDLSIEDFFEDRVVEASVSQPTMGIVETIKKQEQVKVVNNGSKTVRDFVKSNPNVRYVDALQYFSKKEIEKEIQMGRVYRRKDRLFI